MRVQVFRKLMNKNPQEAREMAERVDELTERVRENMKHLPGKDKIEADQRRIQKHLETATGPFREELISRQSFLAEYSDKRSSSKRFTLPQLEDKLVQLGELKPIGHRTKHEGLGTVCPPHGRKGDVAWKLYTLTFGEAVPYIRLEDEQSKQELAHDSATRRATQRKRKQVNRDGASVGTQVRHQRTANVASTSTGVQTPSSRGKKRGYSMHPCTQCGKRKYMHASQRLLGCEDCRPSASKKSQGKRPISSLDDDSD